MHLAHCPACAEELNEQKKMLCALDIALIEDEKEFELPENFTRVVVANAESSVGGLRQPQERFKTLFVCAALFLLVLLGLLGTVTRPISFPLYTCTNVRTCPPETLLFFIHSVG